MEQKLDYLFAMHLSPALAGIKASNMVSCSRAAFPDLPRRIKAYNDAFEKRGLRFEIVKACKERFLVLVYNETLLAEHLFDGRIQYVLKAYGYDTDGDLQKLLWQLKRKMAFSEGFPHEIGLFLGYPVEDVVGFIRNHGKCCKLSGYWKVYGDAEVAQKTFERLSRVCHAVKTRIESGESLLQVFAVAS